MSLSDVNLLILALSPVICSNVSCWHRLLIFIPGLLAQTAVSVLATTCFAFRWYRRLDVLWWYANSFLHNLHKTTLLSRLPSGSFFKMRLALHQSKHYVFISFQLVRDRATWRGSKAILYLSRFFSLLRDRATWSGGKDQVYLSRFFFAFFLIIRHRPTQRDGKALFYLSRFCCFFFSCLLATQLHPLNMHENS